MERFFAVDEVLRAAVAGGAFPGACALIGRGDQVLFRRASGRLSDEADAPACDVDTRFDVASVTKPLVVGMLALRALERGRLCLWDKLETFCDAPEDKRLITVEQLLTHTSGLAQGVHLWRMTDDPRDAERLLLATPLAYAPGTQVRYSSAAYILLGLMLERLYGMPLATLARQEVFAPLHMASTDYLPQGVNIAATERQPDGRRWQGVVHDENARFLGGAAGNAGVFSTVDDLALWMQMLARWGEAPDGARYLARATLREAMRNRTPGMAKGRGLAFALPWYERGYAGDLFPPETVGHTGFTGSSITLDPTAALYVVLLTNRVCPARDNTQIYRVRRLVHNAAYAAAER